MNEQENWYYIRWGAVLVYLSAVFLLIALLFIFPSLELVLGIAVMLVSVVGIVPLIIVINIPFLRMMMGSSGPEPNAKVGTGAPPSGRRSFYSDSVRMHPLIWIIVPLNLYIMVIVLLSSELLVILISLPVVLILSLSLLFFWKLEVQADKDHISFHFGPFGKTVDCSDIRSIRAVEVHALRDFIG